MNNRFVQADNQICYRALCGMEQKREAAQGRHRPILAMAISALRRTSRRKGFCTDCPYNGLCSEPDSADLVDARKVDWHVPVTPPAAGSARQ